MVYASAAFQWYLETTPKNSVSWKLRIPALTTIESSDNMLFDLTLVSIKLIINGVWSDDMRNMDFCWRK